MNQYDNGASGNKTVVRALDIIDMFIGENTSWGVRELAREVNMHHTTIYRTLTALQQAGYLEKDIKSNKYRLGPKYLVLAESYINQNPIEQIAGDVFKMYSAKFDHNFYLGKIINNEVIYITTHEGKGPVVVSVAPGVSVELYCTALGKALLAYQDEEYIAKYFSTTTFKPFTKATITDPEKLLNELTEIRHQGYSLNFGERHEEIHSVGFPLLKDGVKTTYAISIAYPKHYIENSTLDLQDLIDMTGEIAKEVSSRIPNY